MPILDPETWKRLAPHLDEALDMPASALGPWLAGLQAEDPDLAAELQKILVDHQALARAGFLERGAPAVSLIEAVALPEVLTGRVLGEFVLRELVAAGGFGDVYMAEQEVLRRQAVVKVLRPTHMSAERVARFLREAHLASQLDHPYAAHIYAFGAEPDGVHWIAMERVRGSTLETLLEVQGPLPLERLVPLLEGICEVVHSAHEQGIVHRDLKPANVMVISRAGRLLPKLLDFGIARGFDAAPVAVGVETVTGDNESTAVAPAKTAGLLGTPRYMAPELWTHPAEAQPASDQYALGALAYEALTGRAAFVGDSLAHLAHAHATGAWAPLGPAFPAALEPVLCRAFARAPAERFGSVLEFSRQFRVASGVQPATTAVPQIAAPLRERYLSAAPQPIADAVAACDAAKNNHHAGEAVRGLIKVLAWYLGVAAIACRTRLGPGPGGDGEQTRALLRRLRHRGLTTGEWNALGRQLTLPYAGVPDAFPLPELVLHFHGAGAAAALPRQGLVDDRDRPWLHVDSSEQSAGAALERELPFVERLLESLQFLLSYQLVVSREGHVELLMGRSGLHRKLPMLRSLPLGGCCSKGMPPVLASLRADGIEKVR